MFLTFEYGVMYVLSFATIITVFATVIALAVLLVMIACRSIWRLLRRRSDPPPLKWSDLRYVFDIQEDCNGKEAIQA